MLKYLLMILYIIIAVLLGCSQKSDIKPDSPFSDSVRFDTKSSFEEINEELPGFKYDNTIKQYLALLPDGFSVVKFKYFVVFSELSENQTYSIIENDVNNTINTMKHAYVKTLPDQVTPVILFSDFDRYKQFVMDNYDIPEEDISPYGFYKISKNVIIIRYVSWKGSVLHEITHRFLKSDFPDVPSWFDEGLASLHEKSTYRGGVLEGEFSWRIISLRRAIEQNRYTGLKKLMETNDEELYGPRSPFYYAQARYLLMYLQEKGLLVDYYKLFRSTYKKDKTGISQLEKITYKDLKELNDELLRYIKSFE